MKYEYLVVEKGYQDGMVQDGYKTVEMVGGLFTRDKKETVKNYISEKVWLDKMGEEGWELVNVVVILGFSTREYYFKRLK